MKNALVVGGTGMLANLTLWLAQNGYRVAVIGRDPVKMDNLLKKSADEDQITPMFVDYRNEDSLRQNLQSFQKVNGRFDLIVAWIHSIAEHAMDCIIEEINDDDHTWSLFHVLGSWANLHRVESRIVCQGFTYHQIQLGFIRENGVSRWLTHEEISKGVIDCISQNKAVNVVGLNGPEEQLP